MRRSFGGVIVLALLAVSAAPASARLEVSDAFGFGRTIWGGTFVQTPEKGASEQTYTVFVGERGLVAKETGIDPAVAKATPTTEALYAAASDAQPRCGADESTRCVWIVGANGTVLLSTDDAETFCLVPVPTEADLRGAEVLDDGAAVFVGDEGVTVHLPPQLRRTCVAPGSPQLAVVDGGRRDLLDILEAPDGAVVVVGADGLVARAARWPDLVVSASVTIADLHDVAPRCFAPFPDPDTTCRFPLVAVGENGTKVTSPDGVEWRREPVTHPVTLHATDGRYAAAADGSFLGFDPSRDPRHVAVANRKCQAIHWIGRNQYLVDGGGVDGARLSEQAGRTNNTFCEVGWRRNKQNGYRMVAADGGVFTFGERAFHGSTGDVALSHPIVAGASNPADERGYWLLGSDGRVFAFGSARFLGDARGQLASDAVDVVAFPSGLGYWIVSASGEVRAFGDARALGDLAGLRLNAPIVGAASTSTGDGYWLLGGDGGVFTFGDARFFGSTGDLRLNAPVLDIQRPSHDRGYYLLAADGGIFTFGEAKFLGSTGDLRLNAPVVGFQVVPADLDGPRGYWLVASDGGVFSFADRETFGDIPFHGSLGDLRLNQPITDIIG